MSSLPYDGKNGNGIRDFAELVQYLRNHPLAFWDRGFIASYQQLITRKLTRNAVFEIYGDDKKSAILMYDRLRLEKYNF